MMWKCKDGRQVSVDKMTDSHLMSTKRMLDRKGFCHSSVFYDACHYAGTAPDGALMAIESEIDKMKFTDKTDAIFDECEKRGLK